jgi:hypothetical protein
MVCVTFILFFSFKYSLSTDSPRISVTPTSRELTAVEGYQANFSCAAEANPVADIKWYKGGTLINDTSGTVTLSPVQKSHAGEYTCKVNNTMVPTDGDPVIGQANEKFNVIVHCKFYHIMKQIQLSTIEYFINEIQLSISLNSTNTILLA